MSDNTPIETGRRESKTSVLLPPELDREMRIAAEERDWTLGSFVRRAVVFYLDHLLPVEDVQYTRQEP